MSGRKRDWVVEASEYILVLDSLFKIMRNVLNNEYLPYLSLNVGITHESNVIMSYLETRLVSLNMFSIVKLCLSIALLYILVTLPS